MKLKTRLIIAFLVIILVPFLLFSVVFWGFTRFQRHAIEQNYGVSVSVENISDSMRLIGQTTQGIFEQLSQQSKDDPQQFLQEAYLDQINAELLEKHSYLLVRKDGAIFYNGSGEEIDRLFEALPKYRSFSSTSDGGSYIGKDIRVFVKQLDVAVPFVGANALDSDETSEDTNTSGGANALDSDGNSENTNTSNGKSVSEVSVFIVSSVSELVAQNSRLIVDLLISIVVILIFAAFLMIVWIYTGVHAPLHKLSEATHRIKEEDFDFELDVKGKDEISELCRDFDEMRQRLKDLDEEKKAFDRQSKELISNISHDLKTPITAVKGYVEGIMDGVADTPEKMDRYIRTIYIKANDMDRLINELTFYSKIDTNKIPYNFNRIDVAEYFDDCAEEVGLEMRERSIVFSYINTVEPGTLIIADAEQLKRVINNIIGNSVKYMDKDKKYVQLRVMDVGDFVQVELEDNGKGIPNQALVSIFDRFYRTDQSRNSAQGGSGIGLSIVKKIVEDHGGRIWATSKVGEGTVMHFVIRKYVEVEAFAAKGAKA